MIGERCGWCRRRVWRRFERNPWSGGLEHRACFAARLDAWWVGQEKLLDLYRSFGEASARLFRRRWWWWS